MEYDLNQLADGLRFQRLVSAILVARFGEDALLPPPRGPDGASDGETASNNPYMTFDATSERPVPTDPLVRPPRPGRYLFQVKYHRTGEQRISDLRATVVAEFKKELEEAVLRRPDRANVNYFFLVTNVPPSKDSLGKTENVICSLLKENENLHADIWWGNRITTFLDWSPSLWLSFPEIFPGGTPPFLAQTTGKNEGTLPTTFRLAIQEQTRKDMTVKFRQVELEQQLLDLFVDLDVDFPMSTKSVVRLAKRRSAGFPRFRHSATTHAFNPQRAYPVPSTALELLIDDEFAAPKIILEGGPGQGKSTVTQMAAQIYRQSLLQEPAYASRNPTWFHLAKPRLPIRLELRPFADWLSSAENGTLEQYIAQVIGQDAGGASVNVTDIQTALGNSPVILFLDGLDEVGSDALRDAVLEAVADTIRRFESGLGVDLRVVLTTRPPALAGRREKLEGFTRVALAPLSSGRMNEYLNRWLEVQISEESDRTQIGDSFRARRKEPHVEALARNPMQLSVLLQFIHLKGDAFPDRRAELYHDYFQKVIDRDVEKSRELGEKRRLVEELHSFLGFYFHGQTEMGESRAKRDRGEMVRLAGRWLRERGDQESVADQFFALGEERFGLIVALAGEGDQTNYGFEVQPIQEYFAASYISEHLAASRAHEIFQRLLHRSYWREVALFLAGLRRPNEKADLIARARAADEEDRTGRYNGRSMILHLLREGVLNDSKHLLGQALDFVLDLLDVGAHKVQRRPEGLVDAISQVSGLHSREALQRRLTRLADDCSDSEDEAELEAIFRLAARLFSRERYAELVERHGGSSSGSRALVRMTCAYESLDTLEYLAADPAYWDDVPGSVWANRLWDAALRHATVVDVKYPGTLHESLVAAFATSQVLGRRGDGTEIDLRPAQPPAIWGLVRNLLALRRIGLGKLAPAEGEVPPVLGDDRTSFCPSTDVSYRGLRNDTKACLKDLIDASDHALLASNEAGGKLVLEDLRPFLRAIQKQAKRPGLPGWVACRCAIDVLQNVRLLESAAERERLLHEADSVLAQFYGRERDPVPLMFRLRAAWTGVPDSIRLSPGKPTVPVSHVLAQLIRGRLGKKDSETCGWLRDIPFTGGIIKALVEAAPADLSEVMRFVGERRAVGPPGWPRLRVQDTQRVLKICRRSSDRRTLNGAATILLYATFDGIAEPEVVAKILEANPTTQFVDRAFSASDQFIEEDDARRKERKRRLATDVAQIVLQEADQYPLQVVSWAVAFMTEVRPTTSRPLFEESPDLIAPAG